MKSSRIVFIILSIFAAVVIERSIAGKIALFGVPIPLSVFTVVLLLWGSRAAFRIWLAVLAGIFFDVLSIYPWGMFTISFCIAALVIGFLQRIFAPAYIYHTGFSLPLFGGFGPAGANSVLPQIIGACVGIFIVLFFVFWGGIWVEYGVSGIAQIHTGFLQSVLSGIILWSVFMPFFSIGGLAMARKFRKYLWRTN
ncbi:MAG: hypothetical protein HYT98_02465 [Candidatus Sungbacteria bacterium]|nr:hypothetical protein [Candidatus Sungbacteria bacterium]